MSIPELENESSTSTSASASSTANTDSCEAESVNDLGHIIKSLMGVAKVCRAVSELRDGQK